MTPFRLISLLPLLLLAAFSTLRSDVRFADVTSSAGLTESVHAEGVCVLDYDNDGYLDIFVSNITPLMGSANNKLYRNTGMLLFQDVSNDAGVADEAASWS